jgi:hypothetical protein
METIFLKLVHIMLRFFETLTSQDAFALLVDLEHMKFGFFSGPPKHGLKHMGDVIHEIDRVIPANNKITRLQARFGLFLCHFDRARQRLWNGCFCHNRKLKEESKVVELQQLGLTDQKKLFAIRPQTRQNQSVIKGAKAWSVAKKSEHSGVHFVQAVLLLGTFAKE